jgi:membrane dipeptidase
MKHLRKVGGVDCIAIGSDLDGFTDPLDDLKDASEMPRLTQRLLQNGFAETAIQKILGGNVLRVLQEGWGRA